MHVGCSSTVDRFKQSSTKINRTTKNSNEGYKIPNERTSVKQGLERLEMPHRCLNELDPHPLSRVLRRGVPGIKVHRIKSFSVTCDKITQ